MQCNKVLGFFLLALCCTVQACANARQLDGKIADGLFTNESPAILAADQNISTGEKLYTLTGSFMDPSAQLVNTIFSAAGNESSKFLLSDSSDALLRASFGKLFILNRGSASIQVVNLSTHEQEADYSVGAGSNPQDIVLASLDKAYVSRLDAQNDAENQDDLLVINPLTGELLASISLKEFTDESGDQLARAAQMVLIGKNLYVELQDLAADFSAKFTGKLVMIDTESDEATNVIQLLGYNPYDITYSPLTKKIYVSDAGKYLPDFSIEPGTSGIEVIDPETGENSGLVLTDADFAGNPGELRLANDTEAYVLVSVSKLAIFDLNTLEILNDNFYTSPSFYVPDFTIDQDGDIWLTEQNMDAPGVLHLNHENGESIELIDVGASPLSVVFAGA